MYPGSVPQKEKQNPYMITYLSVCTSVKSIYLMIMWKYHAEINITYAGLQSSKQKNLFSNSK